jgi:hypothetical protein
VIDPKQPLARQTLHTIFYTNSHFVAQALGWIEKHHMMHPDHGMSQVLGWTEDYHLIHLTHFDAAVP